ncbi:phage holin family protein [Paenibacillus lactis]|uniref:phage holin family protein n=1 Tax=Paenibacillus lactis TaxID=228574 RepID=UPI003D7408F7
MTIGGNPVYESTLFKFLTYTVGGSIITFLFGGWSQSLTILSLFVVFDYLTGLAASYYEGRKNPDDATKGWNSNKGFWGIFKKVLMFSVIALLYQVDKMMGMDASIGFMTAGIFFYISNELLSIIENYGRLGLPLPDQLKTAVTALKGKSGDRSNQK